MNKPVAIRYDFDGYGYQYMDSGSGSDWQTRVDGEPLYTHPVKELNDGGEPVKNATYWKRQYNLMASQNDNLKSGLYHANEQIKYLESHPVKELTDEEILEVWRENERVYPMDRSRLLDRTRACIKKASEK